MRPLGFAILLAALSPALPARAQPEPPPRLGCDPYSWEETVAPASGRALACGDGRIGRYDQCTRSCSGGCPHATGCSAPSCTTARELCDGAALGGASCRSLGFAGGRLACDETCLGYDVRGCEPCFSRGGVRCSTTTLAEDVTDVRLVASGEAILAIVVAGAGAEQRVRWALAGRSRDTQAISAWSAPITAHALDAIAIEGGWVLGTVTAAGVQLTRIDAAGRSSPIALVGAARDVALWAVRGGGVIVTTGTAFGAPFRALDARGAPITTPPLPAHATRSDGSRMWLLDPVPAREVVDPRSGSMRLAWEPRAGDLAIAFVRESASGLQIVRDGVILAGMGYGGPSAALEVHLGPLPATSGRAETDPLWRSAVPDERPAPGSAWIRMSSPGPGRYRDVLEPSAGRAHVVTGTTPSPPTPRTRMFATHPSLAPRYFPGARGEVLGAVVIEADGALRLVIGRARR